MCPGCNKMHKMDKRWKISGTLKKPTVYPKLKTVSLDVRNGNKINCFLEIKDGMLIYDDEFTTHKFKGKTIPMVSIPELDVAIPT